MIDSSETFRPIVITPTYNNARTLPDILRRIDALGYAILVVNDGSTDNTADVLKQWTDRAMIVTHEINRGKAAALITGFDAARNANFTHAITMDTDGQLDPEQMPELLRLAARSPQALVLSYRDETKDDYPAKSRMGRRLANMMVLIECGARVQDSQCGLRVYPLDMMRFVKCHAGRFGFETEIITRAAWAGCEFVESPVRCRYLPEGQRVSHFKPWRDTLRSMAMHLRLTLRALLPIPHHKWIVREKPPKPRSTESFLRKIWKWVSPLEAWRQVREDQLNRSWFAAGFATGVLIANLPIYGLQTIFAIYTARRLHMHPLAVVAGSNVSMPPINVILIASAISLGHVITHGTLPAWREYDAEHWRHWSTVKPIFIDWTIGGVVLGLFLGWLAFIIAGRLLNLVQSAPTSPEPSEAAV